MTRRRQLLKAGALGATASFTTGAYAQTQRSVRWRMAALYPRSLDTCYGSTEQMCKRVAELTNGKFTITLHPPGDLVPPLQVLDAVSAGTVEAGQVSGGFYFGKNPALMFESGLPFGMNARQQNAWLYEAGGLKEVQKVFAGFNCHSVPCGNFGTQMGGWFRKEINSLKDLSGLKMRIGGFGGQVISRLGVVPQMIPGGDLYAALEKGVVDAAEFVGPYDDEKLGLAKVTQYYYSPGWWEGGSAQVSAIANQKAWAALPKDYQAAFEVAAFESNMRMLAIYDSKNPDAIQRILSSGVKLRWFPKEILDVAYDTTISMLEEISSKDADFKAIYQHYRNFLNKQSSWYRVADHFLDSYSLSRRGR